MEKIKTKKKVSYREKVYVDGKAVTKTFRRKSDAINWKHSFSTEVKRMDALGIGHIESIDFESFSNKWIQMKMDNQMANRTLDSYRAVIRGYLLPALGKIKLERINQANAQKIIQASRKKGLGISRTNFNLRVLKQILNDAVKLNHLVRNPLAGMKKLKEPPRSLKYWLMGQIDQFLEANVDDPFYPLYLIALNTGLRRGELLGLCWDKVYLEERRIEISRTRDRYGLKETTKTGMIRQLFLNDLALEMLKELSQNKHHHSFVFAREDRKPLDIYHLSSRHFKKAIERAGVPRIRFHDLRTTYACSFVMAGGDIFALSKLLGHTSVEMTAKKYAGFHSSFMKKIVHTVQLGRKVKRNSPFLAHKPTLELLESENTL